MTLEEDVRQRSSDIRAMLRQWAAEDSTRPDAETEWLSLRADIERDRLSFRPLFAPREP